MAEEFILSKDATPSFKGYEGFPYTLCISINDEVVHGFPSNRKLKKGDIITIDIGACYKGYHGDSAWTYKVGEITPEEEALLKNTEESLFIVEPMLTLGSPSIYIEDNDWTVVTQDHSPSAHYEHTVVVTKDGYEILTGE